LRLAVFSLKDATYSHTCKSRQKGADEKSHLYKNEQTTFIPQHITEWKKGRSRRSGENALAMLELLKTKPKGKGSTR
jgi:hypothetical protein